MLLFDYEMQNLVYVLIRLSVNAAMRNDSTKLVVALVDMKAILYQICSCKCHGATNCYNRFNAKCFSPTHNRKLPVIGLPKSSSSINVVTSHEDQVAV